MHRDQDDLEATVVGPVRPVVPAENDDPFGDTVVRGATGSATEVGRRGRRPGAHLATPVEHEPVPPVPAVPTVRQDHVPSIRVGGRVVRLDRPVVVGRRPGLPRIVSGPTPELLTVPSPSGQVSASHLLVHAEGETAVVDDLHSTNGTVVRPPGAAPHRMAAGASNVVLTGTVVEIGDGNTIEILSPFIRLAPPGAEPTARWPAVSWPTTPGASSPIRPSRERS